MGKITKQATNQEYLLLVEAYKEAGTSTKAAYRNNYIKLYTALEEKELHTVSEKTIIEAINLMDISNVNTRAAVINIAVVVRRLDEYQLGVDLLIAERENLRSKIVENTKDKNDELNLPSYKQLRDFLEEKYDQHDYRAYIVNYLLLHFQVRNQDLDFEIVKLKKNMTDPDKNYIWYNLKTKKAIYVRNVFKTHNTYKTLTQEITDPKFIHSLREVKKFQEADNPKGTIIKNTGSLATYVMKYTYEGIGEGKYVKVVINHFKKDLSTLHQISVNRGTSIKTLLAYYDITFTNSTKEEL